MSFLENLLDGVSVEWIPLSEVVSTITAPVKLNKNTYGEIGKIPVIDQGVTFIAGYTDQDFAKVEDGEYVIFGDHSEHIKYVDFPFIQGADGLKILKSKVDNTKFIYYALSNFYRRENNYKRHWSSAKGTLIPIPCPDNPTRSIEIQQKIVGILDSFMDLTAELKAELKARKKQYIYYRENLYSFDKNNVKHLPLDDESIGVFQRGKRFVKTDLISEGVPTIHYGEMYTHYGTWADETISFVSKKLVNDKNLRLAQKGDVVIVAAGETIEDIGKGTAWLGNDGVVIHDACFSYKTSLNPKFVAYFTRTKQFHDQIKKYISSGKISAINARGLGKAKIPVPSKEEQEQIVSILDKFDTLTTSITEGLPKEIELRQKQYEYYRDLLLAFPIDNLEL
ncbi:Type I restriction-modification system, specificity subunit S [Sphingobacterium faecium PCAi_F2.5]|nr:Type I restriction-modification system, specificity subunit S [Sphingobacterium faecium PCAi_F2.5]